MNRKILLLGCGNAAQAVARFYQRKEDGVSYIVYATTRSVDKVAHLRGLGLVPLLEDYSASALASLEEAARGAFVLVSYPPPLPAVAGDSNCQAIPGGDVRYLGLAALAEKIIYISSTGVYSDIAGDINESTALPPPEGRSVSVRARLESEAFWLSHGAVVLRAPGLYCPTSGLHKRLLSGSYRLPGSGENFVSRIHLDDLALCVGAVFARLKTGVPKAEKEAIYLLGDEKPSSHLEVVRWLCARLGLPLPDSVPLEQAPPTLRGNRRIDASRIRRDFDISLAYPTYVEGFGQCLSVCGFCEPEKEN